MDMQLKLFGYICRMDDNRLVKVVVLGMIVVEPRMSHNIVHPIKERCNGWRSRNYTIGPPPRNVTSQNVLRA